MFKNKFLLIILSFLISTISMGSPGKKLVARSANFTSTGRKLVFSEPVGPAGKTIKIAQSSTPLDGIMISIPPGAISSSVVLQVYSHVGQMVLTSGKVSEVYLELTSNSSQLQISEAISIHFPTEKGRLPVGYSIDGEGGLSGLTARRLDRKSGVAIYDTFKTGLFTYVYSSDF